MWKRLIILSFSCFLAIAAVVREVVVSFGDADRRVVPVAPLVGEHERADPGHVALEGQGHQVEHQADVLADVVGNPVGPGDAGRRQALGRRSRPG